MFFLSGSSRDIFAFSEKKAWYLLLTFRAGKGAQGKRKKGEAYKMIFTLDSQNYKFSNTLTLLQAVVQFVFLNRCVFSLVYLATYVQFAEHTEVLYDTVVWADLSESTHKEFSLPRSKDSHLCLCSTGQNTVVLTIESGLNCLFTPWLNCKQVTISATRTFFS